jgi:hypothetical protein
MNTKEKYIGMFWGAVLVVIGMVYLVTGKNFLQIQDPWLAAALCAGLSLAFFASYFLIGVKQWGWLFPACFLAGSTVVILLSQILGQQGAWIGAPVMLSFGVPFLVAYFLDREKNQWSLIPTFVMVALTMVVLLVGFIRVELVVTLYALLIALPFLYLFLRDRKRTWALIVAIVLAAISLVPALGSGANIIAPVLLVLGGGLLVFLNFRKKVQ